MPGYAGWDNRGPWWVTERGKLRYSAHFLVILWKIAVIHWNVSPKVIVF